MKKFNYTRFIWGFGFLAAAVYLILSQLDIINFSIGIWAIIWTVVFLITLILSLRNTNIFGSVFSVAFLLMVYAKPLHISVLVPWTLLFAALLISIGLSIVFKNKIKSIYYINGKRVYKNSKEYVNSENEFSNKAVTDESDHVVISQKLSSISKKIKSQNLKSISIDSSLGSVDVYLSEAQAAGDVVSMSLNSSFGNIVIYVPLTWQIRDNIENVFGQVEILGQSNGGGSTLDISGKNSFGKVTIKYI